MAVPSGCEERSAERCAVEGGRGALGCPLGVGRHEAFGLQGGDGVEGGVDEEHLDAVGPGAYRELGGQVALQVIDAVWVPGDGEVADGLEVEEPGGVGGLVDADGDQRRVGSWLGRDQVGVDSEGAR